MPFAYLLFLSLCLALGPLTGGLAAAEAAQGASQAAEAAQGVTSVRDLYGKTVSVCVGTTHDRYLTEHHPQVKLFRVDEASYAVLPVLTGQVSAALMGGALAKVVVRENPRLELVKEPVFLEPIALAFHNAALRDDFNVFADSLRRAGLLQPIIDRWVDDPGDQVLDMEEFFPEDFQGKDFYIATAWVMPYGFLREGRVCGLDVELLVRFCAARGLKPHWRYLGFGAVMAALATGQVDAAGGGIAYSPERGTAVYFAQPHLYSAATLVVCKPTAALPAGEGQKSSVWKALGERFHKNYILEGRWRLVGVGMRNTLLIAFLSVFLGLMLAIPLCGMRMSPRPVLRLPAQAWLGLLNGVPQPVLLMLMCYVVFAGSRVEALWIAVLTFSFFFSAGVAQLFRNALEGLDSTQLDAGRAMGFGPYGLFFHLRFPQALRRAYPGLCSRILAQVKLTSIVGLVSVWDLTKAGDLIRSRIFDAFFPLLSVALLYFLLTRFLGRILRCLGKRLLEMPRTCP